MSLATQSPVLWRAVERPHAGERIDGRRVDEQRALLASREGAEPQLVPGRRRLDRAAQEALELEVEAEVIRRDGQAVGERYDHALVEAAWNAVASGDRLRRKRRIAGQQLVATVASQRDGHGFPREAGEEERR